VLAAGLRSTAIISSEAIEPSDWAAAALQLPIALRADAPKLSAN